MTARTILLYLCGHAGAIRAVAESRAAFVTGLVLVLITTIPRNYDQVFIGDEAPRWLFGSLAFSLVSGTWLFGVAYGWLARWRMEREEIQPHGFFSGYFVGWRGFMGLFWMTAPVAWLYALPVERCFDSVTAARINVGLLATVSLWRVLLMARVFQVLCRVNFFIALVWVLLPAGIETFGVGFFNGLLGKSIMAAMAGLRNSPEEEILIAALHAVLNVSLFATPVALVLALLLCPTGTKSLPVPQPDRVPMALLMGLGLLWAGIAIVPQIEITRTSTARRLVEQGRYREALDYMAARQPDDFAPAVPLPPKTFELKTFEQLPQCIAALKPGDPPWVRQLMLRKLDEMVSHSGHSLGRPKDLNSREEFVQWIAKDSLFSNQEGKLFLAMIERLSTFPEGAEWIRKNEAYLQALKQVANSDRHDKESGWIKLAERIDQLLGIKPVSVAKP